ncbi:unnamed protein product [Brachionus calyciflorus]|uniref:RRM domain-containing protein n=1 Tax=Brachionus calyciflorus TaxID=104777 RepID=A0A813LZU8_9BILA|nr:unnamed protein product [Brachionus calyciflorus]
MSELSKIEETNPEHSILIGNEAIGTCQDLNEIMKLSLNEFCSSSNLKKANSEMSEYFSSPSKSSSQDYSPLESTNQFQNSLIKNNINRDLNNNYLDELENDTDKQVTKLFVGNLPTSTTLPELLAVFKKYGPVNEALSVVKDHNYAFIHFYNRKDAEVALREVNDSLFKDRYIRVQFSTSQNFTTSNKNKGFDKKRSVFGMGQQNKFVYPNNQSMSYSQSTPMLSNGSFIQNNNFMSSKNWRPITSNRIPSSQSAFFDRNSSRQQANYLNYPLGSSTQNNLLIEASKLQNLKLNPYNQYHEELQQKQRIIQALYQQQQQLLQQQIQQQLQQQIQKSQIETQIPNMSIPKSNTVGSFNFGFNSLNTLNNQNLNLASNDKILSNNKFQ